MKTNLLIFFKSIIPIFFLFGCTHQPMSGSMGGWDHMIGYGGYGGMLMLLILIIFVVAIVYFVFERSKSSDNQRRSNQESPTEVLKKRYAKGEITKEEFESIKRDLEQ